MPMVYMLVGIPGSGKTTFGRKFAKEQGIEIISSDEVRNLHPDLEESKTFPEVYRLIAENLLQGKSCVYDATNITPFARHRIVENLEPYNVSYDIGVFYVPCDYKTCVERITARNSMPGERYFPVEVLKEKYVDVIVEPKVEEGFKFVKIIK